MTRQCGLNEQKADAMREVVYKNRTSQKKQRRAISVCERSQCKGMCILTRKHFVYMAERQDAMLGPLVAPEYYLIKTFNTKTKEEEFYFRAKGIFYMLKNNTSYKINFCHSLRVHLVPLKKISRQKKKIIGSRGIDFLKRPFKIKISKGFFYVRKI